MPSLCYIRLQSSTHANTHTQTHRRRERDTDRQRQQFLVSSTFGPWSNIEVGMHTPNIGELTQPSLKSEHVITAAQADFLYAHKQAQSVAIHKSGDRLISLYRLDNETRLAEIQTHARTHSPPIILKRFLIKKFLGRPGRGARGKRRRSDLNYGNLLVAGILLSQRFVSNSCRLISSSPPPSFDFSLKTRFSLS